MSPSPRTKLLVALGSLLLGVAIVLAVQRFHDCFMMADHSTQKVRMDIAVLVQAAHEYAMSHGGEYPGSLADLVMRDERGRRALNQDRLPRDPWDREYVYVRGPVNVMTLGADGKPGGTGDDADLD